ncbi:hypothetical protein Tco_1261823 [Tanacetum coccineum]
MLTPLILSTLRKKLWSLRNFPRLYKKVRFAESLTSTENTKTDSTSNIVSNKCVLHSTRVRLSTSASGSKPSGNTRNDKIQYVCINGDDCMSSDNLCVSNSIVDVKFRAKPKRKSKKEIWKPTGKVFTKIGYIWRPTGRTFTIVGNVCPLTRNTITNEVPSRKPRKNKNTKSVSKTKVIKTTSANKQEPSKSWGSTKTNVPSTSVRIT